MVDVGLGKGFKTFGLYEAAKEAVAENGVEEGSPLAAAMKGHPAGKIFEKSDSTFSLKSAHSQNSDLAQRVERMKEQVYNSPVKKTNSIVDKVVADIANTGSAPESPSKRRIDTAAKEPSPKKKEIWEISQIGSFSNKVMGWKTKTNHKEMSERPEWMNELPTQQMVGHRRGSSSAEEELLEIYRQQQLALKGKTRLVEDKKRTTKDKKDKKDMKKKDKEGDKEGDKKKKKKQQQMEQMHTSTKARDHDFKHDSRNQRSKACTIL
ncbi:hypothetical protein QR680_003936 [Steinernema hermaphroditum]|uniref:Uncharacterized protein n=1 Tax=Steinernema hermaphroditum TaxID=289476 RepID=A0AA39HN61_9BILA|nr:hypothetical protein QR680_003936 [Steinernema hermaphroditum]